MAADPETLAAVRAFLRFYVTGDGSEFGLANVSGVRRRSPALQGPPVEFEALDRAPNDEPPRPGEPVFVDLCGLEDFVLLEEDDQLVIVFFWCTSYPRAELDDFLPKLGVPPGVPRVQVQSGAGEAESVALECMEKLETFLGEDFPPLVVQRQIEFVEFEELDARRAEFAG